MKKILLLALAAIMILSLVACGSKEMKTKNKFTALGDGEVLTIGESGAQFVNREKESVTIQTLSYTQSVTYTLRRSYYSSSQDEVLYNSYYYSWTTNTQTETQELGKKTTKTIYTYEYLPYKEDESVAVKTNILTKVSFDYDGGWIEKPVEVTINLSGYFESFNTLKSACPQLAELIDTKPTQKYYVDVTIPDSITSSETFYNSYYYIEER